MRISGFPPFRSRSTREIVERHQAFQQQNMRKGPTRESYNSSCTCHALNSIAFLSRGRLATRATGMLKSCQMDCLQLHAGDNPKGYTCESGYSQGSLLMQVDLSTRPIFSYGKGDKAHRELEVVSAWCHNQTHGGPDQPPCFSICFLPLTSLRSVLKARLHGCMVTATCLFDRPFNGME